MLSFNGQRVLITGAGSGIGYGLCQRFAEAGVLVALNDMNAVLAREAANQINAGLGQQQVYPYPGDVADVPFLREMIRSVAERFGGLDIAVANAGITNYGEFLTYPVESFDQLTAVNLRGSYFTAQEMIQRNLPGRILLLSSVTGV